MNPFSLPVHRFDFARYIPLIPVIPVAFMYPTLTNYKILVAAFPLLSCTSLALSNDFSARLRDRRTNRDSNRCQESRNISSSPLAFALAHRTTRQNEDDRVRHSTSRTNRSENPSNLQLGSGSHLREFANLVFPLSSCSRLRSTWRTS